MEATTKTAPTTPAVELVGITKRFPGVLANDAVDLVLYRGEVHCLLGENGAGKSTLMQILSGVYTPDAGRIQVNGRGRELGSPRKALELGIGTVYQHSTLVPTLTVLENLMLGTGEGIRLDVRAAKERLDELARMLGVEIDPGTNADSLSLGQQQQIEIVKALWRDSDVLILDEPTSMLTSVGVEELGKALVRLKQHGLAVVFITHKLHEAIELGDRISVLKQGRVVGVLEPETLGSLPPAEVRRRILAMMFGEEAGGAGELAELREGVEGQRKRRDLTSEPALELKGVSTHGERGEAEVNDVSFSVRAGEIFGIAGVDGNGQRHLAEAIAGQRPLAGGEILLHGQSAAGLSVRQRQELGLRYVTDDRIGEGIVGPLSVALNLVLKRIGQAPFWRRGQTQQHVIDEHASELVRRYDVRAPSVASRVGTLSGGNIQKVVLARELSFAPKLVLYNKPTYGLDAKTTQAVRERISAEAEQGVTAIVISTDLGELLDLCDRIAVLFRGRLAGVVPNGPGAEQTIGELMVGGATG
jgi:general nucleoside transport system ATP-binding protein